jgi:GNAT superfamily N-acetyltransferase
VGEVYGMYVDPDHWHHGVGRSLWTATHAELSKTFSTITLWVLEANRPARRFYQACGFGPEPDLVDKPDWLGVNQVRYRFQVDTVNFAS